MHTSQYTISIKWITVLISCKLLQINLFVFLYRPNKNDEINVG